MVLLKLHDDQNLTYFYYLLSALLLKIIISLISMSSRLNFLKHFWIFGYLKKISEFYSKIGIDFNLISINYGSKW
jgi:hypothetical protein